MPFVKHPDLDREPETAPSPYQHNIFGGVFDRHSVKIDGVLADHGDALITITQPRTSTKELGFALTEAELDRLIRNLQWFQQSIYPVSGVTPAPTTFRRLAAWLPMFTVAIFEGDSLQFNDGYATVYVQPDGEFYVVNGARRMSPKLMLGLHIIQEFFRLERTR